MNERMVGWLGSLQGEIEEIRKNQKSKLGLGGREGRREGLKVHSLDDW